jgi:hypothetical protein
MLLQSYIGTKETLLPQFGRDYAGLRQKVLYPWTFNTKDEALGYHKTNLTEKFQ